MQKEIWKPISGYENLYDVSSLGRIRSYPRNGTRDKEIHILHPSIDSRGYCRVALCKDNTMKQYSIHRLVLKTFTPVDKTELEVNHIDGNPRNNTLDNLEWVTPSENHLHRVYRLHSNSLKKCKPVICVETGVIYPSIREAARSIGCDHKNIQRAVSSIYNLANKKHWKYYKK